MSDVRSLLSKSLNIQTGTTSAEEEQAEEDFAADEEGGLGFVQPKDVLSKDRQSQSANDKLRKQLLGSRPGRKHDLRNHGSDQLSVAKPRPPNPKTAASNSSDEAEGRTTSTRNKVSTKSRPPRSNQDPHSDDDKGILPLKTSRKRPSSYLDEILAQRHKKKAKGPKKGEVAKIEHN